MRTLASILIALSFVALPSHATAADNDGIRARGLFIQSRPKERTRKVRPKPAGSAKPAAGATGTNPMPVSRVDQTADEGALGLGISLFRVLNQAESIRVDPAASRDGFAFRAEVTAAVHVVPERQDLASFRNAAADRWLQDGDKVTVGEVELDVIHCPGHTPGHVVFHYPEGHLAIVGDVLFQGSIGRTDFPKGNHQQLIDSITQKLWPLGNDTTFVPGHGPNSTFGRERQTNGFVSDYALS